MVKDGKGYLFPEPPDVDGLVCIKVYVPDDLLYVAAFWGAYEYFTTWLAWQKTASKLGKVAAAVWRNAFDISRAEYDTNGGCEVSVTVNNNISCGCGCGDAGGGQDYPIEVPQNKTTRQAVGDAVANTWRQAMDRIIQSLAGGATSSEAVDDFMLRYPSANVKEVSELVDAVIDDSDLDIDDLGWADVASDGGCSGLTSVTDSLMGVAHSAMGAAASGLDVAWDYLNFVMLGIPDYDLKADVFRTTLDNALPTWGIPSCEGRLIDTFVFDMSDTVTTYTLSEIAEVGKSYRIEGSGFFQPDEDDNPAWVNDCAHSSHDNWLTIFGDTFNPRCSDIGGAFFNGQSYQATHLYSVAVAGTGDAWEFFIVSTTPTDNVGNLTIKVFEV